MFISGGEILSEAFYCESGEAQVYVLRDQGAGRARAAVIMLGPIGPERAYAWHGLRSVARGLARAGIASLRLDYRGTGESTGDFESASLAQLLADAEHIMGRFAADLEHGIPRIAIGLRGGCLLAARLRERGVIDAVISLEPPVSGEAFVDELARQRAADDTAVVDAGVRMMRDEVRARWREGGVVDIGGFRFGAGLTRDLSLLAMPGPDEDHAVVRLRRQRRGTRANVALIPTPAFWRPGPWINPDLAALIATLSAMIDGWCARARAARSGSP